MRFSSMAETDLLWVSVSFGMAFSSAGRQCSIRPRCSPLSYGGYKQSGIGREYSLEGMLDSYTQRKNITVNLLR
jgi:acyl-CoA reductase-like NAD-dependent aldehyde dehydrogenase